MRDALIVIFAVVGLALFVAGDVLWLLRRRQGRPLNLRFTGTLVAAGVLLVILAGVLRSS